uniref:Uncharacterized protein n=1 Tax=Sus scrofa TaxID=9823 RepID=A0A8D1NX21_PIG
FPVSLPDHFIKDLLTKYMQTMHYEVIFCQQCIFSISNVLKLQLKAFLVPSYYFIVVVFIKQKNNQRLLIAGRCIWKEKNNNMSEWIFRLNVLIPLGNVYHVFLE